MLKVDQHSPKTLMWWYQQFNSGRLDMEPAFQRRSNLWSRWKKAHLIDSILQGFDVPKFYVADFTRGKSELNKEKKPYAIIDGKQRFEAVFDFVNGEFALNDSIELAGDDGRPLGGLEYTELVLKHPVIANRLLIFSPVVMSVFADDERAIEEMFVRLNSGESVNNAEKRNAMGGPIPPIMRDLTLHPFFRECISFSIKRMQEFNLAAKLLLIEYRGGFTDTKARNLNVFVENARKEVTHVMKAAGRSVSAQLRAESRYAAQFTELSQTVLDTLEVMSGVFKKRDPLLRQAGLIPVYYWLLRNHPESADGFRDAIDIFARELLTAVKISRVDPERADQALLSFYEAARTTNDQGSLKRRYNYLATRLGLPAYTDDVRTPMTAQDRMESTV